MNITSLKLINWRNYSELVLNLEPKTTLILGENGTGKTNLVEAIYYLSLARSWRTNEILDLLHKDTKFASISAVVEKGAIKKEILIELTNGKKKISINNKKIKNLSDLSKSCNVIVFSPNDVPLFLQSPSLRRNFLDVSISKQNNVYLKTLQRYNELLNQRNALLKNENVDNNLLSVLTQQLASEGIKITKERELYIESINTILSNVLKKLFGKDVDAQIKFHPFIEVDDEMNKTAMNRYENSLATDLKLQHTTVGPHKEDITFFLNGSDLAAYGSQGQNRICVLALKLTPYFLIEDVNEKPIVILDDVTSELDTKITANLKDFVKNLSQVFITATDLNVIGASIIDVTSNTASRRI